MKEDRLEILINKHDIYCLSIALVFSSLSMGFITIIGYFWDKAYAKGFQDAMETKNSILRPGDNK